MLAVPDIITKRGRETDKQTETERKTVRERERDVGES